MRLSPTTIQMQAKYVNEVVLRNSVYQIKVAKGNRYYNAWLQYKDKPTTTIRILFIGNAGEMNAFLTAFQMQHWYMIEPF